VDCLAVIDEVVAALRPQAEGKGLALTVTLPDPPVMLRTDRRALRQIVFNLIGNAIKFTESGGVGLSLHAGLSPRTGLHRTEIRVDDTGVGIPAADHDRLFGAFSRIDANRPSAPEGTGLGLHLSQKLAELLGGKIEFRSESGKGSSFSLILTEL